MDILKDLNKFSEQGFRSYASTIPANEKVVINFVQGGEQVFIATELKIYCETSGALALRFQNLVNQDEKLFVLHNSTIDDIWNFNPFIILQKNSRLEIRNTTGSAVEFDITFNGFEIADEISSKILDILKKEKSKLKGMILQIV